MKEFYDLLSTIQHYSPVSESRTIELSTDENGYKTIGKFLNSIPYVRSVHVSTSPIYGSPGLDVIHTTYHMCIDFMVPRVSDTVRSTPDPVREEVHQSDV